MPFARVPASSSTPPRARRRRPPAATILAAVAGLAGCEPVVQRYEYREIHMGCEARIVIESGDARGADVTARAARAAFDRIHALELAWSDWLEESEVSVLAERVRHEGGAVAVSPDLAHMIGCAFAVSRATGGRFDPTLGALTRLWREARASGHAPDEGTIAAARARTGTAGVALAPRARGAPRVVTIATPGLRFDFGAIGKGAAADEALATLVDRGCGRALIQFGGDLVVGEAPVDRASWAVKLDSTGEMIALPPWSALATSGDRMQSITLDGTRRSHVIDPERGFGLDDPTEVTVFMERARGDPCVDCGIGAVADALATALSVAPPEERRSILARFPSAGALVVTPHWRVELSAFPKRLTPEPAPGPAPAP